MAQGSGGTFVGLGLVGLAGWWVYSNYFAARPAAAPAGGGAPPAPAPGTASAPALPPAAAAPAAPAPAPAPAAPSFNSLDQTYQRLAATVQKNSTDPAISQVQGQYTAIPDVFNYYLAQVSGYALTGSAMGTVFPGGYPQSPISLPAFWSKVAAYLAQSQGLSGMGHYAALAALHMGRRR